MTSNNFLISIVGPTGIGKTALSVKLAKYFNSSIVSFDSRQFYKEMTIGTAVPNTEELKAVEHHFIQNRSIFEDYNVGSFENDALEKLDALFIKNPIQIMVGGSGLYLDAILKGLDYFPKVNGDIRTKLNTELEKKGIQNLQNQLKELDIQSYNTINIENPQRVIRALEICIGTGKPYASFKNKPKSVRKFHSIKIGLDADRETIYNRINMRVDVMIKNGLLEEAQQLYQYKNLNALQTVGYRELFSYMDGNCSKEFAIGEIKKNTRRFAKRQGTWFKKDPNTLWFDYQTDMNTIVGQISDKINRIKQE
ncbi:MAG: tRNA (adenosine(37)-N6)-dimethylallyltransferase MiaA [Polaribacter sp.]|nr:tRNA (adenosine(37)-N6)-dimethylallyltransferase MiaA [Polaribacter sp.]